MDNAASVLNAQGVTTLSPSCCFSPSSSSSSPDPIKGRVDLFTSEEAVEGSDQ